MIYKTYFYLYTDDNFYFLYTLYNACLTHSIKIYKHKKLQAEQIYISKNKILVKRLPSIATINRHVKNFGVEC